MKDKAEGADKSVNSDFGQHTGKKRRDLDPGDRLVAGDWNDDGTFTPALFRPSNTTMYFRYTNTQGIADNQFIPTPTNPTWLPISGQTN